VNPQLESLIVLQDLDLMIREVSDKKTATQMTRIGFEVNEIKNLHEAREELAGKIPRDMLAIYSRLMERYQRAVVPVRNNVCLACFLKQPTKYTAADQSIRCCNNCKRFLYFI
jgi:predicted  nucleic acid-binding Zn-ribbon protein